MVLLYTPKKPLQSQQATPMIADILDLDYQGLGVAKINGKIWFVENALPEPRYARASEDDGRKDVQFAPHEVEGVCDPGEGAVDDPGQAGERSRKDIGEVAYLGQVEADALGGRRIAPRGVDAPADQGPVEDPAHQQGRGEEEQHRARKSVHDPALARAPEEVPAGERDHGVREVRDVVAPDEGQQEPTVEVLCPQRDDERVQARRCDEQGVDEPPALRKNGLISD